MNILSNVTGLVFGKNSCIVMADSIATLSSGDNQYSHSKVFRIGESVVGYVGNSGDAEDVIDSAAREHSAKGAGELAYGLRDMSNRKKREKFEELFLRPKGLSLAGMTDELYCEYAHQDFFEAAFLLAGFQDKCLKMYVVFPANALDLHSPAYLAHEVKDFCSLGCNHEVTNNSLCNYTNKKGRPDSKSESYKVLLETFEKINIRDNISRPYDVYILEEGRANNIPRELNELNAKLFELVEGDVIARDVLDDAIKMTTDYKPSGDVIGHVLGRLKGSEAAVLEYLLVTPRV